MKKAALLLIIFSVLVIASCDNPTGNDYIERYTPGDVIIRFKISTHLDSIYALVDSNNLSFDEILTYKYILNTTPDSIGYYTELLKTKSYLKSNTFPVRIEQIDSSIIATMTFNSLNDSQSADWFSFTTIHNFEHLPSSDTQGTYAFLKVPVGEEKYWAEELAKSPIIIWATVNHIFTINPGIHL